MTSFATADVILVGAGSVGCALLEQLRFLQAQQESISPSGLRLCGVADHRGWLHRRGGLSPTEIDAVLEAKRTGASVGELQHGVSGAIDVSACAGPGTILVDATASDSMAPRWLDAVNRGAALVLANKRPLCLPWALVEPLFRSHRVRYEATVGAGLPLLSTLRTLTQTGDRVSQIEASLSGTLTFLAEQMSAGVRFSRALEEAIERRWAEPDPSDDVTGRDVARKVVILARSCGWTMEVEDVHIEGLIPDGSRDFPSFDPRFAALFAQAARDGLSPRVIARLTPDAASIAWRNLATADPFGALSGADNRVVLETKRYRDHPLVIAGPGAGPRLTAAAVLADLLDLACYREGGFQ